MCRNFYDITKDIKAEIVLSCVVLYCSSLNYILGRKCLSVYLALLGTVKKFIRLHMKEALSHDKWLRKPLSKRVPGT